MATTIATDQHWSWAFPHVIAVETDVQGNWGSSWNVLSGIVTIFFFFGSLFSLYVMYRSHFKWKILLSARNLLLFSRDNIVLLDTTDNYYFQYICGNWWWKRPDYQIQLNGMEFYTQDHCFSKCWIPLADSNWNSPALMSDKSSILYFYFSVTTQQITLPLVYVVKCG
jgi:hypothetical protein